MSQDFIAHTPQTAPEEIREELALIEKTIGFLPMMYAKMAEAPGLMKAYRAGSTLFDQTALTAIERQVVSLTASRLHGCDFCMTAHSWLARKLGMAPEILEALREGTALPDGKLDALRIFVEAMGAKRGAVTEADKDAFFAAGFTRRHALEVVHGVALKVMTNYTNALADTPPNPEFGDINLWTRPADRF